jgi:hypothetical protein
MGGGGRESAGEEAALASQVQVEKRKAAFFRDETRGSTQLVACVSTPRLSFSPEVARSRGSRLGTKRQQQQAL